MANGKKNGLALLPEAKPLSRKLNTAEVVGLQAAFQTVKQAEQNHAQSMEQLNAVLKDLGIENFSLDKNYKLNEQNELVEV